MPTRDQVRRLLDSGLDYQAAGRELGIPPGQVYLIATGVPADGSDTITEEEAKRPGFLPSSQHLASPPHENPTSKDSVAAWLKARVAADEQMRAALRGRTAEPPAVDPDAGAGAADKARNAADDPPAASPRKGQPRRPGKGRQAGSGQDGSQPEGGAS